MQTFRHRSRATALAVVALIVANRPTAAQSLAAASLARWQRSLSDVHSGQAVRLGLIHRGRTEGRWVEASSPQPDSTVIALASPTGWRDAWRYVGRYALGTRAGDPSRRDHRRRHRRGPDGRHVRASERSLCTGDRRFVHGLAPGAASALHPLERRGGRAPRRRRGNGFPPVASAVSVSPPSGIMKGATRIIRHKRHSAWRWSGDVGCSCVRRGRKRPNALQPLV
jgi:hypothetical protein